MVRLLGTLLVCSALFATGCGDFAALTDELGWRDDDSRRYQAGAVAYGPSSWFGPFGYDEYYDETWVVEEEYWIEDEYWVDEYWIEDGEYWSEDEYWVEEEFWYDEYGDDWYYEDPEYDEEWYDDGDWWGEP